MRPTETSAMLQVDLSTLRGPELRQLLDATRKRGQAKLSYEILQEMAARRERGGQPSSEPRLVGLNLGDPLEPDELEMELETAEGAQAAETDGPDAEAAAPLADDAAPLRLEREPSRSVRPPRAVRPPRPPRPPRTEGVWGRRVRWGILGLLAGAGAGYALGFWVGTDGRAAPSPPPAAIAPPVQVADAAPTPTPTAPPPAEAVRPPPEAAPEPTPEISPPAAEPTPPPAPLVVAEAPAKAEAASAAAKGCAAQPTPADQAICGDARLRRLQKALRQAYAEALAAHEDKATLRERQLAWADARDTVTDPDRLAQLYEARIRKLNAAAAEALAAR